jgi:hypothetical protein
MGDLRVMQSSPVPNLPCPPPYSFIYMPTLDTDITPAFLAMPNTLPAGSMTGNSWPVSGVPGALFWSPLFFSTSPYYRTAQLLFTLDGALDSKSSLFFTLYDQQLAPRISFGLNLTHLFPCTPETGAALPGAALPYNGLLPESFSFVLSWMSMGLRVTLWEVSVFIGSSPQVVFANQTWADGGMEGIGAVSLVPGGGLDATVTMEQFGAQLLQLPLPSAPTTMTAAPVSTTAVATTPIATTAAPTTAAVLTTSNVISTTTGGMTFRTTASNAEITTMGTELPTSQPSVTMATETITSEGVELSTIVPSPTGDGEMFPIEIVPVDGDLPPSCDFFG